MKLSIIIVTWKDLENLKRCLLSVWTLALPQYEIIVVDNASGDGSKEMVESEFPQARLILNDKNIGVAKGRNRGLREASGELVLFMDSDAESLPGAIEKMVTFFDTNPGVTVLGPKLFNTNGTVQLSCRQFPSSVTILARLIKKNGRIARDYMMSDWDHNETKEVNWVMGACVMMRRKEIMDIGAFNKNYFYGYDEVDLEWRVTKNGGSVWYLPSAQVIHHYKKKSWRLNSFTILHIISLVRFLFSKHLSNPKRPLRF